MALTKYVIKLKTQEELTDEQKYEMMVDINYRLQGYTTTPPQWLIEMGDVNLSIGMEE